MLNTKRKKSIGAFFFFFFNDLNFEEKLAKTRHEEFFNCWAYFNYISAFLILRVTIRKDRHHGGMWFFLNFNPSNEHFQKSTLKYILYTFSFRQKTTFWQPKIKSTWLMQWKSRLLKFWPYVDFDCHRFGIFIVNFEYTLSLTTFPPAFF